MIHFIAKNQPIKVHEHRIKHFAMTKVHVVLIEQIKILKWSLCSPQKNINKNLIEQIITAKLKRDDLVIHDSNLL